MTILPHHVAGFTLLGGLSVGGYFAINAVTPPTLENKLKELGVDILTKGWDQKEDAYKQATSPDLITGIPNIVELKNTKIREFANELENWCTKRKTKPFYGPEDPNYRRFSLWCTVTSNIETVLKKRGLMPLDEQEWEETFNAYNQDGATDKFAGEAIKPNDATGLTKLCQSKRAVNYKHESDADLKSVIKWCYKKP